MSFGGTTSGARKEIELQLKLLTVGQCEQVIFLSMRHGYCSLLPSWFSMFQEPCYHLLKNRMPIPDQGRTISAAVAVWIYHVILSIAPPETPSKYFWFLGAGLVSGFSIINYVFWNRNRDKCSAITQFVVSISVLAVFLLVAAISPSPTLWFSIFAVLGLTSPAVTIVAAAMTPEKQSLNPPIAESHCAQNAARRFSEALSVLLLLQTATPMRDTGVSYQANLLQMYAAAMTVAVIFSVALSSVRASVFIRKHTGVETGAVAVPLDHTDDTASRKILMDGVENEQLMRRILLASGVTSWIIAVLSTLDLAHSQLPVYQQITARLSLVAVAFYSLFKARAWAVAGATEVIFESAQSFIITAGSISAIALILIPLQWVSWSIALGCHLLIIVKLTAFVTAASCHSAIDSCDNVDQPTVILQGKLYLLSVEIVIAFIAGFAIHRLLRLATSVDSSIILLVIFISVDCLRNAMHRRGTSYATVAVDPLADDTDT